MANSNKILELFAHVILIEIIKQIDDMSKQTLQLQKYA